MDKLLTLDHVRDAASRLAAARAVVRTPLLPVPQIASGLFIKPENLQPTGSFKLRGAYSAITAVPESERRGVVAHSSGNHGYAVAYAAALVGIPAAIVVPENAPAVKTAAIVGCGAELVTVEPTLTARIETANEISERRGYILIPPFDHPEVIAGQGTIGLEIAEDLPDADVVVVPVSGGGLISGIAVAVRALNPRARIIGVEPELAADARDSLRSGTRVAWPARETARTIADALRVEQVGELTFPIMRELVSDIVTVTDEEILETMRVLATSARLVAEPGGAAAVAACLYRGAELPGGSRVAVLSGGNVDPVLLSKVLA
ncbi:MAG: threonine/serine dehydratase [Streptosporangiaceae bacterium]|jgi:threonine dehydratase